MTQAIRWLLEPSVDASITRGGDKKIVAWGTGKVSREFLYVEDAAEGTLLAAEHYDKPEPANLGSGNEITIREIVYLICGLSGFDVEIEWDASKPDGQPRRCLDTSRAEREFGFKARTNLREGLAKTVNWYEGVVKSQELLPRS